MNARVAIYDPAGVTLGWDESSESRTETLPRPVYDGKARIQPIQSATVVTQADDPEVSRRWLVQVVMDVAGVLGRVEGYIVVPRGVVNDPSLNGARFRAVEVQQVSERFTRDLIVERW